MGGWSRRCSAPWSPPGVALPPGVRDGAVRVFCATFGSFGAISRFVPAVARPTTRLPATVLTSGACPLLFFAAVSLYLLVSRA